MYSESRSRQVKIILFILSFYLRAVAPLKCRTEDGPSEAELKRVTRSCMRTIAENGYAPSSDTYRGSHTASPAYGNTRYDHQYTSDYGAQGNNNYGQQNDEDYDSNNNNRGRNYNYGGDEAREQRNWERLDRFGLKHKGFHNYNEHSALLSGRNSSGGSGYGGNNSNVNQRNQGHNSDGNKNSTSYDSACVVHCFFEEMNMLNKDDFPDKQKMIYILTKDMRDRDVRNFYAETIQECFRYIESQRRHDNKCHYSREIINCMVEYVKANCEDWQEFNIMFN